MPRVVVALLLVAAACSQAPKPVEDEAMRVRTDSAPTQAPAEAAPDIAAPAAAAPEAAAPKATQAADAATTAPRAASEARSASACVERPAMEDAPAAPVAAAAPGRYAYELKGGWELDGKQDRKGRFPDEIDRIRSEGKAETGGWRYSEERANDNGGSTTTHLFTSPAQTILERTETHNRRGDREFKPVPPIVIAKYPFAEGATWESTGTDGTTTTKLTGKVLRRDTVEVCGASYGVWVVDVRTTITTAQATVESHGVHWIANQLGGLALKIQNESTTTAQDNRLTSKSVETLTSVAPAK